MNIAPDNKVAVIARYKEQNTFLGECLEKAGYKVITFNKHEGDNLLPNVGREGHTYLHYIVENYDNLPDEVLFSQCDIGDHYKSAIISRAISKNPSSVNPKSQRQQHRFVFQAFLNSQLLDFVGWSCDDYDARVCRIKNGFIDYLGYTSKCLGREITKRELAGQLLAYPQAYYGVMRVSKAGILSREKEFYKRALSLVDKEVNPMAGFYFEKVWPWMFSKNGATDCSSYEHYVGRSFILQHNEPTHMSGRRKKYQIGSVGHIELLASGKLAFSSKHTVSFPGFYSDHDLKYWTIRNDTLYFLDDYCAVFESFGIKDKNPDEETMTAEKDSLWVLCPPLWM